MGSLDPTQDRLIIETGGQRLEGWLTSRVTRGVELCPSHFSCSITERFPGSPNKAVVDPGSTCKVFLGGDIILTGFIDEYSPSYDGHTHNVQISGRSNTEDIVDSSFWATKQAGWTVPKGIKLSAAVNQILEPFAGFVTLHLIGDDPTLPNHFTIPPGETVYSAIEALTRMCVKLLWDDENGNLVISDAGSERAGSALVEGQNVLAAVTRINWVQRFNKIKVATQGSIFASGNIYANSIADSDPDNRVRADRLKVILMDNNMAGANVEFAKQRADWEMNRRIGRSLMVQVHVVGWRDGNGKLWTPNTIVHCTLPQMKVNDDLLITECEWTRDENGTQTVITCMPKAAMQPAPYVPILGSGQGLYG